MTVPAIKVRLPTERPPGPALLSMTKDLAAPLPVCLPLCYHNLLVGAAVGIGLLG
jgi:hypothetical protein